MRVAGRSAYLVLWGRVITPSQSRHATPRGRSLEDVIIEPVRSILIPGFDEVKMNSKEAGALGGGISGSGPSIFMLSQEEKTQAETAGGYAREMSEDYKRRQGELVHQRGAAADVIITTALIPGRPAPVLIKEETVRAMKPGSVIIDMAVEAGGNCPLSELDKIVVKHGVHLIGIANLPGLVATDSSALYARNLMNFLNLMLDAKTGEFKVNREDEIVAGTLVCADGEVVRKT